MAPHFGDEETRILKRAMKQQPDHILTDDDYDRVIAETGVSAQQIENWEKSTRKNYAGDARVAYLDCEKDMVGVHGGTNAIIAFCLWRQR